MALPWPSSLPLSIPSLSLPSALSPTVRDETARGAGSSPRLARLRAVATAPTTALLVMLVGLALLFALPLAGLPFVALVVLPMVIHQLRAEHRSRLRRPARR